MDAIALRSRLLEAVAASDFISEAEIIIDTLNEEGSGVESVAVILKFMEENPALDFGAPGPLAHFIESFYGQGYEAELLSSVARKPTSHTIWLLHRVINATEQYADRRNLIEVLRQAMSNPALDIHAQRLAEHFLQKLSV